MSTTGGMPTGAQRLDQYRRNAALSLHLEARGDFDWAVTTLFYAVLHLVDVYLARLGQPANSHKARHDRSARDPNLSQIEKLYVALEDRSIDARYRCYSFSPAYVQRVRLQFYEPLEQELRG